MEGRTIQYTLQDMLFLSAREGDYDETLKWLKRGAQVAKSAKNFGRNAVGIAALKGHLHILELLFKACEEPDDPMFAPDMSEWQHEIEDEDDPDLDTVAIAHNRLHWEDEISTHPRLSMEGSGLVDPSATLSLYYSKIYDRNGGFANASIDDEEEPDTDYQNPHALDAFQMSPIHYAVAHNQYKCTQFLLEKKANLNCYNGNGCTPLHISLWNVDILELLLQFGADPNTRTLHTGETTLHIAIRKRLYNSFKILIENYACLYELDYMGRSPLMGISKLGFLLLIQTLIRHAHRIIAQNNHDRRTHGSRNERVIYNEEPHNANDVDGLSSTSLSILNEYGEILNLLLNLKKNESFVDVIEDSAEQSLLLAVNYIHHVPNFQHISRILFAKSSDSSAHKDKKPRYCKLAKLPVCHSPLIRAMNIQRFDVAAFLVIEGVDVTNLCHDQVRSMVTSEPHPDTLVFAKLLILCGFPHSFKVYEADARRDRQHQSIEKKRFYDGIKKFCRNPLSLKQQTRLFIRRNIAKRAFGTSQDYLYKYADDFQDSILGHMICEMDIPDCLKHYMIFFPDCLVSKFL